MVERNAGVPPSARIEFRVGIHLGDVVEESDGDLMGDGVNIAARLEGICEPGGVCLSGAAYEQVRDRLKETFIDLGEKALKNIARPVRVYALAAGSTSRQSPNPALSKRRPAFAARQALDRGAAVSEHERRPGAGLFRRRDGRGHRHRTVADQVAVRDRAQFELRLQGQGRRRAPGRDASSACATCSRAACASRATACASPRSSSRPRPARISGPNRVRRRPGGRLRLAGPDHRQSGRHCRTEPAAKRD